MIVQSWDPAQSVAGNSDWSVCTTSLVRDNHFYVLEVQRFRAEAPELINRIVQSARQWHANLVIMEAVGHGLGLYQQVCRKAGCRVMRHEPKGDKVARMVAESPAIEAGYVHLPREADWLLELQREIVNFPNGRHDDQVDSLSQLLYWARMRSSAASRTWTLTWPTCGSEWKAGPGDQRQRATAICSIIDRPASRLSHLAGMPPMP
jgi:predicted phage terminase large subunit-like protein